MTIVEGMLRFGGLCASWSSGPAVFLAGLSSEARARSAFTVSSAQECSCRECVAYSLFRAYESETNAHVVIGSALRGACMRVFHRSESDLVG
jgi:hypothetical protein